MILQAIYKVKIVELSDSQFCPRLFLSCLPFDAQRIMVESGSLTLQN